MTNQHWKRILPGFIRSRLEGRSRLQNILFNTGWLFMDKIVRMGVGLLVGVWIARYLGPVNFGLFNYVTAFIWLFSSLANLGLDGIVVRDLVKQPEQRDLLLGTAFTLKLFGGLVTMVLALCAIALVRSGDLVTIILAAIVSVGLIFQAFDVIDFWFQSQVLSKYSVLAKNAAFLVIALVKVALICAGASLTAFALAGTCEIAIGALNLLMAYRRQGQKILQLRFDRACAGHLLSSSWPLIFSGMVVAVYMKIDQIMLGEMIGNEAVGIYSAAVKISEIWYFIPGAIVSSVFPAIIKAKQASQEEYLHRLQQIYAVVVWLALGVAVPLTFLSPFMVFILYGTKYSIAGKILAIHIWTALFVFYGLAKSIFVQAENMQRFSLVCTSTGAITNIILNLVLIPRYGGIGASVATLCAQFVSAIFIPSLYRYDRISVRMFFTALLRPNFRLRV